MIKRVDLHRLHISQRVDGWNAACMNADAAKALSYAAIATAPTLNCVMLMHSAGHTSPPPTAAWATVDAMLLSTEPADGCAASARALCSAMILSKDFDAACNSHGQAACERLAEV